MFLGRNAHTVDDKGRLALPAKHRLRLAEGLVITASFERCLLVYPMDEFKLLFDKVSALPTIDAQAGILRRMLFMNASDMVPDKQNRVVVPKELREYAGISTEAIVVGVGRWLELWSPEAWLTQQAEIEKQSHDRAALARLGV